LFACLRINRVIAGPTARLTTGLPGWALTGRDSHPLDDRPNFAESPHDSLLSDQHCLVATTNGFEQQVLRLLNGSNEEEVAQRLAGSADTGGLIVRIHLADAKATDLTNLWKPEVLASSRQGRVKTLVCLPIR